MLNLRAITLSNDDVEILADSLKNYIYLTHLDLSHNRIQGSRGGSAISKILTRRMQDDHGGLDLEHLNLSNNKLGGFGCGEILIELLNDGSKLDTLNLGYNSIEDF